MTALPDGLDATRPIVIYGPTASGKSELALRIAERFGGEIINADASQVFANWQVLSARPGARDLARAPHHLYGHLPFDADYSVGHWLRDVTPLLSGARPIIVGGTGLYMSALTEGLVDIPATPKAVRAEADALRTNGDVARMIADLDAPSRGQIDLANPMRVQRAWEVLKSTGRGIASWQADTPAALLPRAECLTISVVSDTTWLIERIARRFDLMLEQGALEEARANLEHFDGGHLSMKAIGARELIGYLRGTLSLDAAREQATIATRQFAKRQRTWARARMRDWQNWHADA
ncbi:tRNA (adenosine(37)-N6)-dimethylallyltransferase MiaA [Roseobacteraceae bacterium S113]